MSTTFDPLLGPLWLGGMEMLGRVVFVSHQTKLARRTRSEECRGACYAARGAGSGWSCSRPAGYNHHEL